MDKDEIQTYVELKYQWPTEDNYNSIRNFSKSLPPAVLSEIITDPEFGIPISFGMLIQRYKIALNQYHANN